VRFGHRHRPTPVRELTGFAVESLPGEDNLLEAADEIREAADRLGGRNKCFFGGKATVPAVRKYAPGSRYVHFAGHSVINDERPLHSGIPMSDGFLHAFEMFSLGLAAEVVVLSACQTAVGQARPGEGVVGLSRALFAAGARAVLLTRWQVNSLATTIVMNAYYEGLARGRAPAYALAAAIRKVRNDRPTVFEHPREWAAFFLLDTHAGG
jgi:CHAT domain-containing protein